MTDLIHENSDLKKKLRESEDLRKGLVTSLASSILHDHAATERLGMYQDVIDFARTLRDPDSGSVNIENLLSFFEALDRIPVPS